MRKKVLLDFREVNHWLDAEAWDLRDFSWKLHYGERVRLRCQRPTQYDVLWRLLQRNLKPKRGVIEELRSIPTSSDEMIASRVNQSETMNRALESKLFDEHLWINGRRVHVQAMMDRLEIPLAERHIPVRRVTPPVLHRFHALLFMAARVQLLLGRQLLPVMDRLTAQALRDWHPHFPGALVLFGDLPHSVDGFDTSLEVLADGSVEIRS